CVADYLKHMKTRVFPVGRLDWASEGLLLLTNDGDWAQKILHPKEQVTKTYLVKVDGIPSSRDLEKLKKGVSIIGGKVRALFVAFDRGGTSSQHRGLRVIIAEGKKHQVRLMFQKIGFDVLRLRRVAIGRLRLGSMKPGELRPLTPRQRALVFQQDQLSLRYQRSVERTQI
ncbi:MAG: pseudouridine synthase, partial [Pseudobdellovibrionaceae bacterium]|nr:pseudouridine synthase [Pseudobdellovibrionaceae bacterium]